MRFRLIPFVVALVAWVLVLASWPSLAQTPATPDCTNPQAAADSVFQWLREGSYHPRNAGACIDAPPGTDAGRLAVQLKSVLDARGLYAPVASLPSDPAYVDDQGRALVSLFPDDLPVITLVKSNGQWRYSRDAAVAIPSLYAATFSDVSLWFQNRGPSWFHTRVGGLQAWQLLYGLSQIALAVLVGLVLRTLLRNQVKRFVDQLGLPLDERSYRRTNGPFIGVVVTGILWYGLPDLQLPLQLSRLLMKGLQLAFWVSVLVLIYEGIKVAAVIAASYAKKTESRLDDQAIPLLRQSAHALLFVVGLLVLSDTLGFDVWKLAAGVGVGSLAFALAAQDTVANMFGSLNIFLDRPFQIGDWIKIGSVEGVVEEVGFRSTRVRTFYNSLVTIPNNQITNANVDNLGVRPRRRIKHKLALTYDTPPDVLEAYATGVRAVLAAHPYVQNTFEVHVYELAASSIDVLVYYHVVTPGWHEELETRAHNLLEFVRLAQSLGVSFAFPTTSVHVEATPERPLPDREAPTLDELQSLVDGFGPGGAQARPHGPEFARTWTAQALPSDQDRGSADG